MQQTTRPSPTLLLLAIGTLIGAFVGLINWRVIGFDWVMFDDDINILVNPHLGRNDLSSLSWALQNMDYMRRYLPLGWFGFDALLTVDGYNPTVFHCASWLLSSFNAALLFLIIERLCRRLAPGAAWRRYTFAALGAVLWALHPLRSENTGWISGLLYLGSAAFAFGAVLLHLVNQEAPSRLRAVFAGLLYLASVMVYPVFLALPALLVWFAFCVSPDRVRSALRETWRLLGWWLAALFSLGTNLYARLTVADHYEGATSLQGFGIGDRLLVMAQSCLHYVAGILWPANPLVYYGRTDQLLASPAAKFAVAAGLALAVLLLVRRSTRLHFVGWSVAGLLAVLPFFGTVDASFHASDRYLMGTLAIMAAGLALWATKQQTSRRTLVAIACGAVITALYIPTYQRALDNWKNTWALQLSIDLAGKKDPAMNFARPAVVFWLLGDRAEGYRRIQQGLAKFPGSSRILAAQADIARMEADYAKRVGERTYIPPMAVIHYDLGRQWQQKGAKAAAYAHFSRAVILCPDYMAASHGLLQTAD